MTKGLSNEEMRICDLMGINPHEFIESRGEELAVSKNRESPTEEEAQKKVARLMGIPESEIESLKKESEEREETNAPLSEEELKVCRLLNVEPLEYYAQKQKEVQAKQ